MGDVPDYQIDGGHAAVWVSCADGSCIGRFGKMGIDVHKTLTQQLAGEGECLECTHGRTTPADWHRFVASMMKHYQIDLSDMEMPEWLT